MSFLDEFEFAFQDIKLFSKITSVWKYWENIKTWETQTDFRWVIQEIKDFSKNFLDNNKNLWFTSKDFEMRCNNEIIPKKWDRIEDNYWSSYDVIFVEIQPINWEQDHVRSIIRLNN
jgi:hypothetical protein